MSDAFKVKNILHQSEHSIQRHREVHESSQRILSLVGSLVGGFKRVVVGDDLVVRLSNEEVTVRRRKLALSVGSVLLVLLSIIIFFGWRRRVELTRKREIDRVMEHAAYVIGQAKDLSRLSPARARQILTEEEEIVKQAQEGTSDETVRSSFSSLLLELSSQLASSGRVFRVDPAVFTSLDLLRQGSHGDVMNSSSEMLVILDRTSGVVLTVSPSNRSGEVIGGGSEFASGPIAIAAGPQRSYVLMRSQVIEISTSTKTRTPVVSDDGQWSDPISISFFGGNLYLLDRGRNTVLKYPAIESGFGTSRRWFRPGVEPDLSDAVQMAIDGDVWILHGNGRIEKFRNGAAAGFRLAGVPELSHPVAFSVPVEGTRVWILDQGSKRVVAVDRETGEYRGEWNAEILQSATGIAVIEKLGKIFVLGGSTVYQIDSEP